MEKQLRPQTMIADFHIIPDEEKKREERQGRKRERINHRISSNKWRNIYSELRKSCHHRQEPASDTPSGGGGGGLILAYAYRYGCVVVL